MERSPSRRSHKTSTIVLPDHPKPEHSVRHRFRPRKGATGKRDSCGNGNSIAHPTSGKRAEKPVRRTVDASVAV